MDVGLDGLEEFGFEKHLLEVEALEGGPIEAAVFGRPAVFSEDPERDRLAEDRLARSADIAEPAGDVGIGGAKAAGAIWTT